MLLDANQVRHWSASRQQVIKRLGLPVPGAANDALILHRDTGRIQLFAADDEPLHGRSRRV